MKMSFICLFGAALFCWADDNPTAQISSSPTPTPPPLATHPAVMAQEIALFRPWDGTVWLTIHRRGENGWRPSSIDILTDYKPIVKKVRSNTGGWEWQIRFTNEIAKGLP